LDVKKALTNLSKDGFISLVKNGSDNTYSYGKSNCMPINAYYSIDPAFLEFENRKMMIITREKDISCNENEYIFTSVWTKLGNDSYNFILVLIGNAYGEIRMQVEKEIITQASTEIKSSISNLSKDEFIMFVKYGYDKFKEGHGAFGLYCDSTKEDFYVAYPYMSDLINRGIIEFLYKDVPSCPSELLWQLTPLGEDAYIFITDVMGEALASSFSKN